MKNKKYLILLLICLILSIYIRLKSSNQNNTPEEIFKYLSISTTNTWCEYAISNPLLKQDKLAWIGSIIFKSKNAIKIKKLQLRWMGNFLDCDKITASLYHKKEFKNLMPIEQNLICDGNWDKTKQILTFDLDEKLVATQKYYLMLNFPETLSKSLQNGSFKIFKNNGIKIYQD